MSIRRSVSAVALTAAGYLSLAAHCAAASIVRGNVSEVMTGDNNGGMAAGMSTEKLSTSRADGNGFQVWQGGVYNNKGANGFHLIGSNGSAFDMSYAILTPAP
mgnify:CR=1 FL=1